MKENKHYKYPYKSKLIRTYYTLTIIYLKIKIKYGSSRQIWNQKKKSNLKK